MPAGRAPGKAVRREFLLGCPLRPGGLDSTAAWCIERVTAGRKGYVCAANVHVLVESVFNPELRDALFGAAAVVPDGMPLVWFLRMRGHRGQNRVYGPDLMLKLLALARKRKLSVYLYGSDLDTLGRLGDFIRDRFPCLKIAGSFSPPFTKHVRMHSVRSHCRIINRTRPDIVFVGLGAPKQEVWMRKAEDCIAAPLMVGVGAAFDFHSGGKRQAPRWMMRAGLEWFFRLATEPGRLWKRYLIYNSIFIGLFVLQMLGKKRWGRALSWEERHTKE